MDKKPFMSDGDIDAIDKVVLSNRSDIFMGLEWGSGSSTIYYVNLLREQNRNFEWHAVEHNPSWATKVRQEIQDDAFHMHLFDYKAYTRGETRKICMKDYVECAATLNKKFDLIIVDGRCRVRCLAQVKKLLKENGVVFLHDACRKHYDKGKALFDGVMISDMLWKATNG